MKKKEKEKIELRKIEFYKGRIKKPVKRRKKKDN